MTSNQSRREGQQERDFADVVDLDEHDGIDITDQMPLRAPNAGGVTAKAQNELPMANTRLGLTELAFESHGHRELDDSDDLGVESVQVSTVHFHLHRRQFRHRAGKNIKSGLQYLISFIYKKEPRRVFESLEIIR